MTGSVHSYLNQIFYKHKKFDDASTIAALETWMLLPESIICNTVHVGCKEEPVIECPKSETYSEFRPVKPDSLFWCAYAIHHGEADYWAIGNKYRNAELSEKQRIIDSMNLDPAGFKRRFPKMSNVGIQEIMAELMIDKKTSWKTFYAMCAHYGFRAIVVYEKTYLDFSPISDVPLAAYLFRRTKEGHISVITEPISVERLAEIKTTHICLGQNPDKPLKAASNYKVDELIDLAEQMGVDIKHGLYNKWKKSDWYESIINKCKW
jgi:hypothetical protein